MGGKEAVKDTSFLLTLQRDKIIDSLIVSMFVNYQTGNSTMKFGSWDKNAIKKDSKLELYKTKDTSTWSITGESFTFQDLTTKVERYFSIDPQFPFVYIPKDDWLKLRNKVGSGVAVLSKNWIKFDQRCENMPATKYDINFTLPNGQVINLPGKDLLVTGKQIGTGLDNCYLGVFQSKSPDQQTWYVGGSFLKSKYVVYDMTPLDEQKKNYIQVGIGETNTSIVIGEKQYDHNSIHYYPKPEEKDATSTMVGFEDPYVVHAKNQEAAKVVKDQEKHKKAEN